MCRFDAAGVDTHRGSRRQRTDAAKQREWLGNMAPQEKSNLTGWIWRSVNHAAREQGFDLRRHANRLPVVGEVQRLDTKGIAGQQHSPPHRIPDYKCEHATERLHHLSSAIPIELNKHFRIA